MKQAKIIAFVGTQSPAEATAFYRDRLGLELVADEPSAIVFNAGDTMLRVSKVDSFEPTPFTVLGWDVADIRQELDRLVSRGVGFERFDGFGQDDRGIATFPDGTHVAWFRDPDGNMLSLTQFPGS